MLYNYATIFIFLIFGLLVPYSFVLISKLIRKNVAGNSVKNAPWESAEETIGSSRDVDNEYMPYFMLFLPFEMAIVILIVWSTVAKATSYNLSLAILSLGILSVAFSLVGYKFASGKNG
jgi:NADH:ubiquinone oxidoreductase subunit 3 (subunit A)